MTEVINVQRPKHSADDEGGVDITLEGEPGKVTIIFDKPVTHLELDGRDAAIMLMGLVEAGTVAFKSGDGTVKPKLN